MRGCEGNLCYSEKEIGKVLKDYIEGITNEESDWDCNVEGDVIEGALVSVGRKELLQASIEMEIRKVPGRSEVSLELIVASGGVGTPVMTGICQSP